MLEVITGCMFSGKTNYFIDRVHAFEENGNHVVRLKPVQDSRYAKNDIVSHDGKKIKGLAIEDADEIWEFAEEGCEVLAIDEVQFFSWDFPKLANDLANRGVYVLVAGVDLDFRGKPFGIMPELMSLADIVIKHHSRCGVCGSLASRSQRLVNGKPAKYSDPIIISNPYITYEPRCRLHHEVQK